ncbi:immunoglobulin-like domain-containing protein, partial [Pseudoneobacillus sp. C159]
MRFSQLKSKQKWFSIFIVLLMLMQYIPTTKAATQGITNWNTFNIPTYEDLYGVSYGGGKWIAVGGGTTVAQSTDGISWMKKTLAHTVPYAANAFYDAIYTGSKWIIVGASGSMIPGRGNRAQIYTSPDGDTWTSKESNVSGNDSNLMSIAQNGNTLVAVGNIGYVFPVVTTSTDGGETWTNHSGQITSPGGALNKVTYGNGLFVAVGENGNVFTSSDGMTWTKRSVPTTESLYGAVYSNGKYYAVGHGFLLTSSNGVSWNIQFIGLEYPTIASSGGELVIVSTMGRIVSSMDGATWTPNTTVGPIEDFYNVNYGDGKFVAVGHYGLIATRTAIPGYTPSSNADLSNLTLSTGTLTPNFSSTISNYTTTIANANSVELTATTADSKAKMTINGVATTSGSKVTIPLAVGSNPITIVVLAENGISTQSYLLTITSVKSSPLDPFNQATTVGEMRDAMEAADPLFIFQTEIGHQVFFTNVKNDKDYVYRYMIDNRPPGGFADKQSLQKIIGDGINIRSPYMNLHETKDGAIMLYFAYLFGQDFDFGIDLSGYESFIIDDNMLEADRIGDKLSARIPTDGFIGPTDLQAALNEAIQEYVNESLLADKTGLAIIFANGDDETHVTQDIELPNTGVTGPTSKITWTSSNPSIIKENGTVTRPTSGQGDASITLTATIDKNGATDTKAFTVLVKALGLTDADAVHLDKQTLDIGYQANDHATNVTHNLLLKTAGPNGTTISWSSSSPGFVAADGTVTRPTYAQGDQTVTLTATITKNGAVETKLFTLKLPKLPMSDSEAVGLDKAELAIGYSGQDNANSVTKDVLLKTTGQNGTTISWSSNASGFVGSDGKVTRPTYSQGDQTVSLTATISKNGAVDTKSFTLKLPKLPMSDSEAVGLDKAGLEIGYNGQDDANSVTNNVVLKTAGQNGTTISWSSNATGFVSADGTVTRPTYTQGDQTVT